MYAKKILSSTFAMKINGPFMLNYIIYMDPTDFVYKIWFGWLLFASFCGETLHFPMQTWLAESPARETRPRESGRTLAFNQKKGADFGFYLVKLYIATSPHLKR